MADKSDKELKIGDDDSQLIDNNNLNRVAIEQLRARLTTLYNRPTVDRENDFEGMVKPLFDRYAELTNRRTSKRQHMDAGWG